MKKFCLVWLILFAAPSSYSQTKANVLRWYDSLYTTNLGIENGLRYEGRYLPDSHPFFGSKDWTKGGIYMGEQAFDYVELKYDISRQQLVLKNIQNGLIRAIQIELHRVDSFRLKNKVFVPVSANNQFGEKLYAGKNFSFFRVLSKDEVISIDGKSITYEEYAKGIIRKGDQEFSTQNLKHFIKYFSDYRSQIKSHVKEYNLQWTRPQDIVQICRFTDNLIQ